MSNLIKFYTSTFAMLGLSVGPDGAVLVNDGKQDIPFTVKTKALYLPTDEAMRRKPGSTYNFHPLLEDVVRNESFILTEYRRSAMALVNLNIAGLVGDLIRIAASPDMQKGLLDPKQHEVTSILKGASANTVKAYNKLIDGFPEKDVHTKIIKMNIRKNGVIEDKKCARLAVVTSPLLDALDENVHALPEKHIKIIREALLYVLPRIDEVGAYNCGSSSQLAPTFHATLLALYRLFARIEELAKFFSTAKIDDLMQVTGEFNVVDILPYIADITSFDSLRADARRIPMQPGNEGQGNFDGSDTVETPEPAPAPVSGRRDVSAALKAASSVEKEAAPWVEPPKQKVPDAYRQEPATATSKDEQRPKKFGSYRDVVHSDQPQAAPGQIVRRDEMGNILDPNTNLPYGVTVEEIVPKDPHERPYLVYMKNGQEVDPDNNYRPFRNSRYDDRRRDDRYDDRRGGRYDRDDRGRYDRDDRGGFSRGRDDGRGRYDRDDRGRYDNRYDDRKPTQSILDRCQDRNGNSNYFETLDALAGYNRR